MGDGAVVDRWLASLVMSHGVGEVAKAYLRLAPAEKQPAVLRSHLAARADEAGGHLEQVIRADFARADTIALNGWIVSRTEARLSALRFLEG